MSKILRVGNLPLTVNALELSELASAFGEVSEARVMESQFSGKSRGFGFVEMHSEAEAEACLAGLHEKDCAGQQLAVTSAPADQFKKLKKRK